jgi:NADH dehydrogenase
VLAVIGRNKAVARLGKRVFTGFFAWLLWLGVHLFNLIGFRNRLLVLVNWAWDYVWFERGTRLILPTEKAGAKVAAGGVTIRPRDVT